jgi:hypothetical protein
MTAEATNTECARRIGSEEPYWRCPAHGEVPPDRAKNGSCPWCGRTLTYEGPNFHGSMDAAMQLVEFTYTKGYSFYLEKETFMLEVYACTFGHPENDGAFSENESPSAAICAAFLEILMP